ncbi:hypothetical protein [Mycobacterium sp. DL592]|uniref:hypothetical protein n=1 Tax=Mycobacterium sp. DL592 TaxID=2675524 RepID=UPI00141FFA46|nr:hypothetical protein [Mycobacterium sp. DL592]
MSTWWTYLRIQGLIFVFGIVGPIFLILYFVVQPDPTVKWMYYTGLVITAVDILIALSLTEQALAARPPVKTRDTDEQT